ncbi:MAG TPA: CDP-alcohol phosphatidyltransferase family protein [Acidimicrobiales bacterium]|nr:CDP-alcohol phosphatidyltransferase family protein [Acidimicrobiales bacterium]
MASSFGPSALATPANAVTIARLVVAPALCALIVAAGASYPVLALWIVLAATDGLDGWLARRMGTTRSGAFLDPLADKALVLGAMWSVVAIDTFWWVPVALITLRELAISGFRSYWGRRGLAVPATFWAKVKTVVQAVAVGLALLPPVADSQPWLAETALWLAVGLTLASGAQYVWEGSRATASGGVRV